MLIAKDMPLHSDCTKRDFLERCVGSLDSCSFSPRASFQLQNDLVQAAINATLLALKIGH